MSHNFSVGDRVTYSAEGSAALSNLTDGDDYIIETANASYIRLETLGGVGPITVSLGSGTHSFTGQNSGSSEVHSFNGAYAGENETHTFTNEYAGPSESHFFKSTQYAGHNTPTQTFQGRTALATPVMGEDDVPDQGHHLHP